MSDVTADPVLLVPVLFLNSRIPYFRKNGKSARMSRPPEKTQTTRVQQEGL